MTVAISRLALRGVLRRLVTILAVPVAVAVLVFDLATGARPRRLRSAAFIRAMSRAE